MYGPHVKAVLMAGGGGERFWPRSRPSFPKQFLDLDGRGSLLKRTYERVLGLIDPDNIYVATRYEYAALVKEQLVELPEENLIVEPVGRDTAPGLGLAAMILERADPQAIMVALPSDHLITDEARFLQTLRAAVGAADELDGLVTLGVHPTRPETGYGYIQVGDIVLQKSGLPVHEVVHFHEKPDATTAQRLVDSGDHLWNSGMFVWRVRVLREEIARHLPALADVLDDLTRNDIRGASQSVLKSIFARAPRISIDYGVLERSDRVFVVPAYFGWDDIGTWAALDRMRARDELGNSVSGPGLLHNTRNVMIDARDRVIAAVGVSDVIIVDSPDAVLVCHKSHAQEVKIVSGKAEELIRHLPRRELGSRQGIQASIGES